ncbi:MAG: HEPN domain-containing protein [Methanomicrobiales archaeon]
MVNRANPNLILAKNQHGSDIYFEDLYFNAQQVAKKAIKAVFIFYQILMSLFMIW